MKRWLWLGLCIILGLGMLLCGLLVPVHLRALDASVVRLAGRNSRGLVERGLDLVSEKQLGAAQLLSQAAQAEQLPGREKLALAIADLSRARPDLVVWGGGDYHIEVLFKTDPRLPRSGPEPATEFLVREENRRTVLVWLEASTQPAVQELLRCRALTNTTLFAPSTTSAGQALDTAVALSGLMLEERKLSPGLSNTVFALAAQAARHGSSEPIEQVLYDLMSLGRRFNWGQLVVLAGQIEDPETLGRLTELARRSEGQLPILFAAVQLSGRPAEVVKYLMDYSQTGLQDLGASLRYGSGGIRELLRRQQRLCSSGFRQRVAARGPAGAFVTFALDYCWLMPAFALAAKWFLYLASGFLLAAALHFARPRAGDLERPLEVRGFHVAREILFAVGFLAVVLLVSEPFLAQESQRVELPLRLRLPTAGSVGLAGTAGVRTSIMNQMSLLTLLLFFVLQALIYTACLVKLAEIRRQLVPARIKLRLLENEDHLFDAGLYLGFVGTIISLILVSLGIIKPSLMAAYSSTSFGIIFVSIFKIFHLRPVRRRMLLEAEAVSPGSGQPGHSGSHAGTPQPASPGPAGPAARQPLASLS